MAEQRFKTWQPPAAAPQRILRLSPVVVPVRVKPWSAPVEPVEPVDALSGTRSLPGLAHGGAVDGRTLVAPGARNLDLPVDGWG